MDKITVSLSDRISVPTERTMTDAGQMHVPCKFARTGSQQYTAAQLGLVDRDATEVVSIFRDEADVFDEASMDSFRSAPVTLGHPTVDGAAISVSAENAKELQVGMLEGMPTRDEDTLGGTLILTTQEAIDALEDGTQELSAGYTCDIEMNDDGELFQRNIRANHIAIVAKGRAGSSCRISDEALELTEEVVVADEEVAVEEVVAEVVVEVADEEVAVEEVAVEAVEEVAVEEVAVEAVEEVAVEETVEEVVAAEVVEAVESIVAADEVVVVDHSVELADANLLIDSLKVELADAVANLEANVVARSNAIENARLISDLRVESILDKSVSQIERMVVEDQMPEKDLTEKSSDYVSAMFEILIDASKGETPMGKLLGLQNIADATPVAKPVNKVAQARQNAIARSKKS